MGEPTLASKAIRGTILTAASVAGSMIIRLGSNAILSRLLSPDLYGQMALLVAVDIGLRMLSDVGTSFVVINNARGDEPRFYRTVFTVEALRGVGMWLVALLIAWPYAQYTGHTEFSYILPIFTFSLVISGFTSPRANLLRREMKLGLLTVAEIGEQVIASLVSILYALFVDRSLWALIVGTLAAAVVRVAFSYLALPAPPVPAGEKRALFAWDKDVLRQLEGRAIFLSTALTYFAQRFDILIMPKFFMTSQIGVYNTANQLAQMPLFVGARIIGAVFMPAMSTVLRENPGAFPAKYVKGMFIVLLGGGVACVSVAIGAPSFFYVLYDPRWHDTMWMCPLLVAAAWPHFVAEAAIRTLLAMGNNRPLVGCNAVRLAGTVVFSVLGYQYAGIVGFVLGNAAGAACGAAYGIFVLRVAGLDAGKLEAVFTVAGVAIAIVGVGAPYLIGAKVGLPPGLLGIATTAVIAVPMLWFSYKSFKARRAAVEA